jgi:hypothetical protein
MKSLLVFSLLAISITSNGQKATAKTNTNSMHQKVQIINAGERSVSLLNNYFNDEVSKQILKQISVDKFAEVKSSCNEGTYPACFKKLTNTDNIEDDAEAEATEAKIFKQLKVYRIAKYDNIQNGKNFGEESILIVPASENKNIGGSCNLLKDIYIIIYTKAIKVL